MIKSVIHLFAYHVHRGWILLLDTDHSSEISRVCAYSLIRISYRFMGLMTISMHDYEPEGLLNKNILKQ
jgi:hypothetical protein